MEVGAIIIMTSEVDAAQFVGLMITVGSNA